jgi:hypothetical protein
MEVKDQTMTYQQLLQKLTTDQLRKDVIIQVGNQFFRSSQCRVLIGVPTSDQTTLNNQPIIELERFSLTGEERDNHSQIN